MYIPWNLDRLKLVETDLRLWIFLLAIFNLINNQITGRFTVPKIGTRNIIMIGRTILAVCPLLLVSVSSYFTFMLVSIPFGAAIGFVIPSNQTQVSYIESKTNKIYSPVYQACFSAGSLSGALGQLMWYKKALNPKLLLR